MAELSRDEAREMRDTGRRAMEQVARVAREAASQAGMSRTFARVSKVNADGTLQLELGSDLHPMPLYSVRMTTACAAAQPGDTVVVDTYAHVPLATGVIRTAGSAAHMVPAHTQDASTITGTLPVAHGGTGATTAAGARSALGAVSKSGDTVAGPISRAGGGSFGTARNNATVCGTSHGQQSGYSFNAVASQLTSSGSWTMGNLSGEESLAFAYTTNKDYDAGNNSASLVRLPAKQGTIVTSASVGSGLKFHDGTLSVDNGAYVNLYKDSANNGYCAYRRSGGLVCVVCDYLSSTAKTSKKLGTLPAGCRPARTVLGMAYPRGANSCGQITVDPDGEVSLYTFEGSSGYVGGSVTFPLP
ncbi:hypothetical protein ACTQV1_08485 [Paratractidigestivibacter faecalis]|uniref:hypothetical protein n=1 Tax=Paratractidigestivibacter faecalis TaxID=2292441 RepID=UPI003F99D4D2